jgi:methionine synthase II (cobalamin-independent)
MLSFEQLQQMINAHLSLIEVDSHAFSQARERAARFLVLQAHLAGHLKILEDIKVKASTIEKAEYAQAMMRQSGKNVTENKINAEADPSYAAARESVELVDAEINWTKKHYEIFENAHVMFRQIGSQT